MSFYLLYPSTDVETSDIIKSIKQRLECYEILYSEDVQEVSGKLNTLVAGSDQDCISHSLLRIKTYDNSRLQRAFTKNEVKLMELRLGNFTETDLKGFVKKLKREATGLLEGDRRKITKANKKTSLACVYVSLHLLRQGALEHAFKKHVDDEPCEDCDNFCFQVDFEVCLDLVASSKYYIHKGKVHVYNFEWKILLISIFKTYLINILNELKTNEKCKSLLAESRISSIFNDLSGPLSKVFAGPRYANPNSFPEGTIDDQAADFPPCMRSLYNILQKDNRLGHQARFNFSLFLKSIGMSMEDQLAYWEGVYLKNPGKDAKCTHTWEKESKRYTYSIRHMYGLEGSKVESFVKSCIDIEDIKLAVNEEGGCPFAHDDDHSLKKLVKAYLPIKEKNAESADAIEVMIHERKKLTQKGCQVYFKELMRQKYSCRVPDEEIKFDNPGEFYLLTNKFSENDREMEDVFDNSSSSDEEASNNFLAIRSSSSSDGEANENPSLSSSSSNDKPTDHFLAEGKELG